MRRSRALLLGQQWPSGYRWNSDLYPLETRLSTTYHQGRTRRILRTSDFEQDLDELDAVYFRRFEAGSRLPQDLGKFRDAYYQESVQTVLGTLGSLSCFQLDPFWAISRAEHKEMQIKIAADLGLHFPRTLFSNDPDEVLRFAGEVGPVVAKVQAKTIVHRDNEQQAAFTSSLEEGDLHDLEGLKFSPMIVQERIEKAMELRVTVVGDQVFPAAIDTTGSEKGAVDWRLDDELSQGW